MRKMQLRNTVNFIIHGIKRVVLAAGFFFASCIQKNNDYSIFPQGSVLAGDLKDGRTLYLVRNDSTEMSGVCFVHDNQAVVDVISYFADSVGNVAFQWNDKYADGKIVVDKTKTNAKITIPSIPDYDVTKQKVDLICRGKIPGCITCRERYREEIFDAVVSDKNIQYGTATGYYTSNSIDKIPNDNYSQIMKELWKELKNTVFIKGMTEQPLHMDVYYPENDTLTKRPVFLFIHGGAFFFGDKENPTQQFLTGDLVKKGYVVVSVNYRLGSTAMGFSAIERAIYRGVQDTRAALRYITCHSKTLGIDPDRIYIGGSSAGGIIALTAAFMDEDEIYGSVGGNVFRSELGALNDSGNDLDADIRIAGVVSLWGGISGLEMINNNLPTILFHGTKDDIVRCDSGLPFKDFLGDFWHDIFASVWQLYGSSAIYDYMNQYGMPVKYVPFPDCGHELHLNNDGSFNRNIYTIRDEINLFLYSQLSGQYVIEGDNSVDKPDVTPVYRIKNAETETVSWHVEGGLIIDYPGNAAKIVWYNTSRSGKISACITDETGISYRKEMMIDIINN
jgi:predicted esterase